MANLLDDNNYVFEKMCYDKEGNNICKPIESQQKLSIELAIIDMHDSDEIKEAMKKLGYKRTDFGLTGSRHIRMEFEKKDENAI